MSYLLCIFLCLFSFILKCIFIGVYVCSRIWAWVCMCVLECVCMCVFVLEHVCMYLCMLMHLHRQEEDVGFPRARVTGVFVTHGCVEALNSVPHDYTDGS